jgi:hypothetical protein
VFRTFPPNAMSINPLIQSMILPKKLNLLSLLNGIGGKVGALGLDGALISRNPPKLILPFYLLLKQPFPEQPLFDTIVGLVLLVDHGVPRL